MNLFWKNLFGKIPSTLKIEQQEADLLNSMQRYDNVAKSDELKEFNLLFKEIKSPEFIENKKLLQNRKYSDTEEHRDTRKLRKLERNANIHRYYRVLNSPELQEYLDLEKTAEFSDLGSKQKISASEKLQRLKNFQRSKAFKTYTRFHNSFIIKEFEKLRKITSTEEFKEQNAFWANSNRWQTTPEFQKEQRYYELKKNPDIQFYRKTNPAIFENCKSRKLIFEDKFDRNTLEGSHWDFGFHYSSDKLIANHSFANEQQANTGGKNVSVTEGVLKIHTKFEKVTATAWHETKGFINKEFLYTSDVLQTANKFHTKGGVFQAKLRCMGKINHAFWLGSDHKQPHINIFYFDGKVIKLGNINRNVEDGITIHGLNPANYYIYTLKWTENELIWLINDLEVYRTANNIPKEEMFPVFNSFITNKQSGTIGSLEVDWIRVYE